MRPLSWLLCDRPCRSNCGTPAEDGLARIFQKVLYVRVSAARPRHSPNGRFFPSLAPKPSCRGVVSRVLASRRRQVAASVVRLCCAMGSNVRSIVQSHKRPCDKNRIAEGRQSESARQAVYAKRCYTAESTVQRWSVDQTGRVPFTPIYLIPISPELSGNILLETSRTSRNFRTILDCSGSF